MQILMPKVWMGPEIPGFSKSLGDIFLQVLGHPVRSKTVKEVESQVPVVNEEWRRMSYFRCVAFEALKFFLWEIVWYWFVG
jgi:hypothetical protein